MNNTSKVITYIFLGLSIISIFGKPIMGLFGFGLLNFLDEGILVFSILFVSGVVAYTSKIKFLQLWVLGFFLYSLAISLLVGYNRNFTDVFLQSLINVKFFLIFMPFMLLFRNDLSRIESFFRIVMILSLVGFGLHLLFETKFNGIFDLPLSVRQGSKLRFGGFLSPNQMAFLVVVYLGILFSKNVRDNRAISRMQWLQIFGGLGVIVLTGSRTPIVAILALFIWYYWDALKQNAKTLLYSFYTLIFILGILFIVSDVLGTIWVNLQGSFSVESYYVRGIIINMALQICYYHFPIGTGAATFGSLLSGGSRVYEEFGVADRYFFVEKVGIYDSSIASVLGEYGIIGIIFYAGMFVAMRKQLFNAFRIQDKRMVDAMIFVFLFYSVTNPTFTNNIYILMTIPAFLMVSHNCGRLN